jgi:8-oxo-dGTP pyrophosphatase MutT (NUDIX family)
VYDNSWLRLEERHGLNPAGRPAVYGILHMKRLAVGVLPIDAEGFVHLVGQWRPPLNGYSWEMPEGGAEHGEDAAEAARRELAEEAGLRAGWLTRILEMDLSNSTTDERAVLFLAAELTPCAKAPDETEILKGARVHFTEVLHAVCTGAIRDSLTVAAVLRAHHMSVSGALPPGLAEAMAAAQHVQGAAP